jgi:hypothetical protein
LAEYDGCIIEPLRRVHIGETPKISKPKRKRCRAADQPIGGRTLIRAARPPAEIMEIDLPRGGVMRKPGGG